MITAKMIMPSGFITLFDYVNSLPNYWSEISGDMAERDINDAEREVVALLGGEKLQSFGWNYKTGDILSMPASIFRTERGIDLVSKSETTLFAEHNTKVGVWVIPLIRISDIFGIYKKLAASHLKPFDASKWQVAEQGTNPDLNIVDAATSSETISKGRGRPRTHNWDLFYHELVAYVDDYCISHDGTMTEIRNYMKEWAKNNMKPNAPDFSQIKKKLRPIETNWHNKNGSKAK
jgi:hypothetical protein